MPTEQLLILFKKAMNSGNNSFVSTKEGSTSCANILGTERKGRPGREVGTRQFLMVRKAVSCGG